MYVPIVYGCLPKINVFVFVLNSNNTDSKKVYTVYKNARECLVKIVEANSFVD